MKIVGHPISFRLPGRVSELRNRLSRARYFRGHGVHSPFVYDIVRSVFMRDDLLPGMELPGIVNNITDFGAFVDLGVHESGLLHLSQISDKFIKHPSEALTLYQHVRVKVIEVDKRRKRISLSMKGIPQEGI